MSVANLGSPPRDPQLENLIESWPDLPPEQQAQIEARAAAALRRRVWELVRDTGPLPVAGIAGRLQIPEREAGQACGELRVCCYFAALPDGEHMRYSTTGLAYNERACERRLAQIETQRGEQQAMRDEPAKSAAPVRPPETKMSRENQSRKIVAFIRAQGDATRAEIEAGAGVYEGSVCWRLDELQKDGVIRKTGRTRKTHRGGTAQIFELTGQPLLF